MTWPPAPVDDVAGALLPLGEATMLPAAAYTSDDVLAWELRHLFAGTWTCVGRLDELLPERTTQYGTRIGPVPVLLTKVDGGVAAFANTCRHRGHELVPEGEQSALRVVECPYHAWTYTLSGALRTAPRFPTMPTDHDLVPLPAQVWHGWVFVNASGDAVGFEEYVGALADLVAPYAAEHLVRGARHEYEVEANWKIIVENYQECYHCPHIHPELCKVSPPTSGSNYDLPGAWTGGTMDLSDDAETMSLDGRSQGTFLPAAPRRQVLYVALFPALLLSMHPDYVMTHRLTPRSPHKTAVECSWYVAEGVTDAAWASDFWHRTNHQDWTACESVQRGVQSPHFHPGPFAPSEDAVHQWTKQIARAYKGTKPWQG